MTYQPLPRKAFSTVNPWMQLAWDSTSLGLFKECPRKYFYSIICGYMGDGENVHLKFGIWYHKALELYDKDISKGFTHDQATFNTVKWLLLETVEVGDIYQCEPLAYPVPPGVPVREGYGCGLEFLPSEPTDTCPSCGSHRLRVTQGRRPWVSDDDNKTRFNLVRTVVWYLEQFKDHPTQTVQLKDGTPAVELSFRFESGQKTSWGESYLWCGHLDRLATIGTPVYVLDRKTSKSTITQRYFEQYSPDNQMSLYTFAGKVCFGQDISGVIIDAAQIAVNFSRFERGFADRTVDQVEEWVAEAQTYIDDAERYAEKANILSNEGGNPEQAYRMNDKSCHNYGGCQFRGICSKSPKVREDFLKSNFPVRIWDPLETR